MGTYETDFYSWTIEQATAIRSGRYSELDVLNLVEELESMGRSEKRALESRLTVLLVHMLKWAYQPQRRGKSWKCSIDVQRKRVTKLLAENPGLKPHLSSLFADAYEQSTYEASQETGLDLEVFPVLCPWSFEQVMDSAFYPE